MKPDGWEAVYMRHLVGAVCLLLILVLPGVASAQGYPVRAVRMVVAYPPGGGVDIVARILAGPLNSALKQPIVVDNRSGAAGMLGHALVAKAAPDGYTLLLAAAGPLVGTKMMAVVPYDPAKDFTSIAMVANLGVVLVSSTAFKPRSVPELIEHAKANPGKVNLAINAVGSLYHILAEQMMLSTGTTMNRIPYKGAAPAMLDLVAGAVDVEVESLPVAIQNIRAKRILALAVASNKRSELLPNVPTFAELGMPEMVASPWYALIGPAGVPKSIVVRLNKEVNEILRQPSISEQFSKQGIDVVMASADETERFVQSEIRRWDEVVIKTGMKLN